MSFELTELTESSPSAPPPSVLCGSGILSKLASPWSMASCDQTYDCYNAVEALDPACTECLAKGKDFFQYSKCHFCFVGKKPCCCPGPAASNIRRYLWSKKDGPLGKEFPVSEGPTPDVTSGYSDCDQRDVERWTNAGGPIRVGGRPIYSSSAVTISRINTEGVVKQIRRIADSPPDLDAEPPAKRFQSRLTPSTPRNFQPTLATIPNSLLPASPSSCHDSSSKTIPHSTVQSFTYSHLSTAQVEEEESFHLCLFLLPKYFRKGRAGLSELPEKIQIQRVKIKMLWPGFLDRLIGIVGR
ncbi:hypothetical protein O181_102395 [Austropuccinia psidii MF-1]|uniref:Uncharacterized protein n=1 Tax=Austropuccinia psidii MF-1 TaxID=1389203 RepID=A0A9Q3JG70_9BASI|nr:hypothetical protein [Austropuccinia psidii MF-1]